VRGPGHRVEGALGGGVVERGVAEAAHDDRVAGGGVEELQVAGELERKGEAHRLGQVRGDRRGLGRDPQRLAAEHLVAPPGDRLVSRGHHAEEDVAGGVRVAGPAGPGQEEAAGSIVEQGGVVAPHRLGHGGVALVAGGTDRVVAGVALAQGAGLEVEVAAPHLIVDQGEQLAAGQAASVDRRIRIAARGGDEGAHGVEEAAIDRLGRRGRLRGTRRGTRHVGTLPHPLPGFGAGQGRGCATKALREGRPPRHPACSRAVGRRTLRRGGSARPGRSDRK